MDNSNKSCNIQNNSGKNKINLNMECNLISPKRCSKALAPPPSYLYDESIIRAHQMKFSHFSLTRINNAQFRNYLGARQLSPNNMCDIFKVLLHIEDLTILSEYIHLLQYDVNLRHKTETIQKEMMCGYVLKFRKPVEHLRDKIKPFMDEVVIVPKASSWVQHQQSMNIDILLPNKDEETFTKENMRRHVAIVKEIYPNSNIFVQYSNVLNQSKKYDIIFRPLRILLRYQYKALELLSKQPKMRKYLFPEVTATKSPTTPTEIGLNLINTGIANNPEQLEAVHTIVSDNMIDAPYVIFGPPGTGKTTILVESIIQLRLRKPSIHILVTAGANSVCDRIALELCSIIQHCPTLNNIIKLQKNPEVLRIFSKAMEQKEQFQYIDEQLIKISNCFTGEHFYPDINDIRKYKIIIATLSTVGKLVNGGIGANEFFTHVIIDEAAACTEIETLLGFVGIVTPGKCRVILAGDPKQLGPVIISKRAAELGLSQSLMDRLLARECYALDDNDSYDHSLQVRLRRNYRSHPEIVRLFNDLYYNKRLLALAKPDTIQYQSINNFVNPNFPIIFQEVYGDCVVDPNFTSSYNVLEAEEVKWHVEHLLTNGDINGKKIRQRDIAIITPYRAQYCIIECYLNDEWPDVEIGTVETFQGREKPIVITSLVRSFTKTLGFVSEPRRLNVLLSRAKSLLILIGNPYSLCRNPNFDFIISECMKNETFIDQNHKRPNYKNTINFLIERAVEFKDTSAREKSNTIPELITSTKITKKMAKVSNATTAATISKSKKKLKKSPENSNNQKESAKEFSYKELNLQNVDESEQQQQPNPHDTVDTNSTKEKKAKRKRYRRNKKN